MKLIKSIINVFAFIGFCTTSLVVAGLFITWQKCSKTNCPNLLSPQSFQPTVSTLTPSNVVISPSTFSTPATAVPITLSKYDSLNLGMSYEQVVAIIGQPTYPGSTTEIQGLPTTTAYLWRNPDSSSISLGFQDNQLKVKSQFGLK